MSDYADDNVSEWEIWLRWMPRSNSSPAPTAPVATIKTWIPAQAAIAGVAAIPPTPAQINYLFNKGWNSSAHSISEVVPGQYFDYTIAAGTQGAIVGLDRKAATVNTCRHGILMDASGIWVWENGTKGPLLRPTHIGTTTLRIYRQNDQSVVYLVITGSESLLYKSTALAYQIPLYGHGWLYASGDTLNSSAIPAGEVQFGRV